MSDLSDMTPQAYRAHHTLMLLTKHWDKVYSQDPVKESTHSVYHYSQFQADSSGSTYEFKICPDCRKEDLRAFSMTYWRSEEHTSELQSLMSISYAVFCLKKKNKLKNHII